MTALRNAVYSGVDIDSVLWPDTEALLSRDVLGRIAGRARAADESGRVSEESLEELRGIGYCGLPVPRQFQGGGASLHQCAAMQRRLAEADPALAIAMNMHLFSVGTIVEHWSREKDSSWLLLEAIATQHRFVASAFAEPGLGGSFLRSNCTAIKSGSGYVVNGTKSPCSLVGESDLICMQLQSASGGKDVVIVALVPSKAPGLRVERSWDALGMRASESNTLHLENCFVPDELVFHTTPPGLDEDEVFASALIWFCVTTTATYVGVLEAALGIVNQRLKRSNVPYLAAVRADLPSVQSGLGDCFAALLNTEAACCGLASRFDCRDEDPRSLLPVALAVKYAAVEALTRAVADAGELLGGQSYSRQLGFERLWRDVQAARFHPPTRLATRQILGRWGLGLPFTFELYEEPSRDSALGGASSGP